MWQVAYTKASASCFCSFFRHSLHIPSSSWCRHTRGWRHHRHHHCRGTCFSVSVFFAKRHEFLNKFSTTTTTKSSNCTVVFFCSLASLSLSLLLIASGTDSFESYRFSIKYIWTSKKTDSICVKWLHFFCILLHLLLRLFVRKVCHSIFFGLVFGTVVVVGIFQHKIITDEKALNYMSRFVSCANWWFFYCCCCRLFRVRTHFSSSRQQKYRNRHSGRCVVCFFYRRIIYWIQEIQIRHTHQPKREIWRSTQK